MTSNHIPPMASNMRFNRPNLSLQSSQFEDYLFEEQHSSSTIPQLMVDGSTLCEPQQMNSQPIHQSTMSMSMLSSGSAHPPNYNEKDQ
uniref:Uncharacterized protein n=1 Tax=Romanomermis culicivorax TaxID=13658 RepID=A0A915IAG1_ROMCU